MLTIIYFILIFSILVIFHEGGHFLAAKIVGIRVKRFGLGFGKKIFSYTAKDGCVFSFNLIPLGGFVDLVGMCQELHEGEKLDNFCDKNIWQRFLVIFSGPLMNFVLAILIIFLMFFINGIPKLTNQIKRVEFGSPAYTSGIRTEDKIVKINNNYLKNWGYLSKFIQDNKNKSLTLEIKRFHNYHKFKIIPTYNSKLKYYLIGISPKINLIKFDLKNSLKIAIIFNYKITKEIILAIKGMLIGEKKAEIAGPIGIIKIVNQASNQGFLTICFLTALLSLNLGLFNLFPIPILDGGKIFLLFIELIRRKPLKQTTEMSIAGVGFIILILLVILVTCKDILSFF